MHLEIPLPFTVLKRREEENCERDFVTEPTEVATAPTVYGVETIVIVCYKGLIVFMLQQHLPFTVLKPI